MPDPTETRWSLVVLTVAAGVIIAMQIGKVLVAIPLIRMELEFGLIMAGWIISIYYANAAMTGVLMGIVADSLGHRRALLGGMGLMALGSLAGSLAESGTALLLARFVEGVGFVMAVVSAPSLIASVTAPADRRKALAFWGAYMPTGITIMILVTPAILTAVGWRGLWVANGMLMGGFAVVMGLATRHIPAHIGHKRTLGDIRLTLSRPGPLLLAGCFACYTVQFVGLSSWLPTFLIEVLQRSTSSAANMVAGVIAANIVGNLMGGWLLSLGFQRWKLVAFSAMAMGVLGIFIYAEGVAPGLKLALAAAFTLVGGITPAALLIGVPEHAPSPAQIGTTNGTVVQGLNVGSLLAPPAFAVLVTLLGDWSRTGWLFFAAGCLGLVFALALRRVEANMQATRTADA